VQVVGEGPTVIGSVPEDLTKALVQHSGAGVWIGAEGVIGSSHDTGMGWKAVMVGFHSIREAEGWAWMCCPTPGMGESMKERRGSGNAVFSAGKR